MRVYERAFPGEPAYDVAVSRALLLGAADGSQSESLRLYRPDDVVAFSVSDASRPGFGRALEAARGAGFDASLRLAGGSAAVFHRDTVAFAWCLPAADARRDIRARFERVAALVAAALRRLGVDARVGEVEGEYCPGDYSVNAGGQRKLMGVGQRIVQGAAHVGGVIVVDGSARVRDALVPVYASLGLAWRPETAGSIADEVGPLPWESVRDALLAEIAAQCPLEAAALDDALLVRARELEPRFRAGEARR
ncbi:MAG TPA: lipoate--protein ligase family protein [Myxococcota bacterium]|nr:lipoate--protein ligase family protein [Myxococcota bacterium]